MFDEERELIQLQAEFSVTHDNQRKSGTYSPSSVTAIYNENFIHSYTPKKVMVVNDNNKDFKLWSTHSYSPPTIVAATNNNNDFNLWSTTTYYSPSKSFNLVCPIKSHTF